MAVIQTLVVCEKPDAAARVARALDDDGDPRRSEMQGVPFYESKHKQETIFVCSALGHLYAVDSKSHASRRYFPVWDCLWRPKNVIDKKSAKLARWTQTIGVLAKRCDRCINACDYDLEGSLIGYTILRYACNGAHSKAERMKFSTMTEREIQTAYKMAAQQLDFSQVDAAQCRHELDWLYGINLTRLLTESALKQGRGYSTLSTGRVQGPTLRFVVEREDEIQCFTPTPFWTIEATIDHGGQLYSVQYEREKVPSLTEAARIVEDCKSALLEAVDKESRTVEQSPPHPFNLSALQSEAYRHFGYTPARTLALAERLYLEALISYPRTSSQKLPPDIGYREILNGIEARPTYRALASKLTTQAILRPNQGVSEDPAHPAVYPTGESPKRTPVQPEINLLDLITRRFMATFAAASLREDTKLTLANQSHRFFLRGSRVLREGWIEFYRPYASIDSRNIPDLSLGEKIGVKQIEAVERFTEPPPRFNPSSLLRKMEDANIGTKATRAEIIEILYRRGYIRNVRIQATPLAINIIAILDENCPLITGPEFTSQLENQMERIRAEQATRSEVLIQALEHLRPVLLSLMSKEDELGERLADAVVSEKISNLTFNYPCPACGSQLRIIRSRISRKRFIGCAGYQKGCRFTLPLPQFGSLTITTRNCKTCGFQMIGVRSRRGRTVASCPRCYSKRLVTTTTSPVADRNRKARLVTSGLLERAPLVKDH